LTSFPGPRYRTFSSCQASSIDQISVSTCPLAQLSEGRAQRGTGDLDQPLERPVELQDQKKRAGNRECADEKGSDYGSVARGKEPKTANIMASQNTSTIRNRPGIELSNCSNNSTRVRPRSRTIVSAWLCRKR